MAKIIKSEAAEPGTRDARGRWIKGVSGNGNGRPRKRPPEPWTLHESMRRALAEEVPIDGPNGPETYRVADVIIRNLVRGAAKAKPRDVIMIVRELIKLNAFDLPFEGQEEESGSFTEEHRQLMEMVEQACLEGERDATADGDEKDLD